MKKFERKSRVFSCFPTTSPTEMKRKTVADELLTFLNKKYKINRLFICRRDFW